VVNGWVQKVQCKLLLWQLGSAVVGLFCGARVEQRAHGEAKNIFVVCVVLFSIEK